MTTREQRRAKRMLRAVPSPAPDPTPLPAMTGATRLLFLGDTAGTGFGTVTRDLGLALHRQGVDLRILSLNEDADFKLDPAWPEELKPRTILLGDQHGWLGVTGPAAAAVIKKAMGIFTGATIPGWRPDAILAISDHATLEISPWLELIPPDMPAFVYEPIEGVGLPPSWSKLWDRFKPIAMCNFGADQIEAVTHERPPVVYHGIDPESFWPVTGARPIVMKARGPKGGVQLITLRSRAECRAFLNWPKDATILFRADRHMPRKAYPAMLRALAPLLAKYPRLMLFLHCRTIDKGGNLWHESSKYPEFIRDRIGSTGFHDRHGGAPRELLNVMYNASDLYISTCAEGFGLCVAESLACGTPAVALAYSSLPEVVGPAGICVDEWALTDNIYSYFWAIPKGDGFTEAVERLVLDPAERRRLGALGPGHIRQFSWDTAAAQMAAIFTGAEVPEPAPVPASARLAALGLVRA